VAYRADIEIAVKGQAAVNKLQRDLIELGQKIDEITKRRVGPSTALQTFNSQLQEATRRLNEVAAGTSAETEAVRNYVTALGNANTALSRQNNLIADEIRLREAATNQTQKLAQRQEEFTARTNEAARAAHRQTAEFYRQQRVAKEVAKLNAAAPPPQLLLAPAAPGAPAMGGGARRRITGAVERLGGARAEDEAARALRFAQASREQIRPLSQIQALFTGIAGEAAKLQRIKALPDSQMLNASARGIKQLENAEDSLNRERQESAARLEEIDRLEEGRLRRARKLQDRQQYMAGKTPAITQPGGARGGNGRVGGAISSALIGGGFPLLFGQGAGAAAGGALGGLAGGLLGGGFGFALSIVGTAIGDAATKAEELDKALTKVNVSAKGVGTTAKDVGELARSLGIAKEEAVQLLDKFTQFESSRVRSALAFQFGGKGEDIFAQLEVAKDEETILQAVVASRKILGNQKARELVSQLELNGGARAQLALQEALIRAKEREIIADKKRVSLQDILLSAAAAVGDPSNLIDPAAFGKDRAKQAQIEFDKTRKQRQQDIQDAFKTTQELFSKVDQLSDGYRKKDKKEKTKNNNALFNEQARQAEQLARNQIALDNAIFRNKMALADEEFAARQRIAELQGRLAEAGAFGAQREVLALINATSSSQSEYFAQARQLSSAIAQATQELKSANAMVGAQQAGVVQTGAGGMSQGRYIQGGIGPRGANQYGPHFDIKRSDGGYYSRTALDKYVQVNGRPLSSGVTVPGGEYGAPRSYGPHAGRDYAFSGKAAMTLTGGAKFISSKASSYGDATAFMTPDGKVYKVIHGKFEGTTQAPPPQQIPQSLAKGQSQVIGATGDVAVAQVNEAAQIQRKTKLLALLQQERDLKIQIAVAQGTEFLRNAQEQTLQIEREIEKRKIRNRLALEGVAPEIIEGELRVYDITKQKEEKLKELTTALSLLTKTQQYATEATLQSALADLDKKQTTGSLTLAEQTLQSELQQRLTLLQQIKTLEGGTPAVVEGIRGAAAAQVQTTPELLEAEAGKAKLALQTLVEPANMIASAAAGIGDAFATSFKGVISGSMTAKEALANFFTSVADMFLDMAAQIIAKMITMAILNAVLGVLPGGNSASALGSNPNVGAYSGTGIEGITMGTFGGARAAGGPVASGQTYMVGERGPELFVPGRSGTIVANDKMGGGNTNVVVNVDAKGSSVEGDEQGANQLGRVISAAVQSELIKQQRPGGILAR